MNPTHTGREVRAGGWRRPRRSLSPREDQILRILATGRTNKEIAAQIFLSTDTVKYHLKNLYGKLGARTRTEALVTASQVGLIQGLSPPP